MVYEKCNGMQVLLFPLATSGYFSATQGPEAKARLFLFIRFFLAADIMSGENY